MFKAPPPSRSVFQTGVPAALIALGAWVTAGAAMSAPTAQPALQNQVQAENQLGPDALEKCRAFRQVKQHADELQRTDGGALSAEERAKLEAELAAAKRMPGAVTPAQCSVAL